MLLLSPSVSNVSNSAEIAVVFHAFGGFGRESYHKNPATMKESISANPAPIERPIKTNFFQGFMMEEYEFVILLRKIRASFQYSTFSTGPQRCRENQDR